MIFFLLLQCATHSPALPISYPQPVKVMIVRSSGVPLRIYSGKVKVLIVKFL